MKRAAQRAKRRPFAEDHCRQRDKAAPVGHQVVEVERGLEREPRPGQAGDQAFTFIGNAAFSGEGQVRAFTSGPSIVVEANTVGANGAEMSFTIEQPSVASLLGSDFIL